MPRGKRKNRSSSPEGSRSRSYSSSYRRRYSDRNKRRRHDTADNHDEGEGNGHTRDSYSNSRSPILDSPQTRRRYRSQDYPTGSKLRRKIQEAPSCLYQKILTKCDSAVSVFVPG